MSYNARFIWDNLHFDESTLTADYEDASWPVTNLQVDDPATAYKTGVVAGPVTISCDLSTERPVDTVVFAHHNLIATAGVTINVYSDQARTTLIYSQVWDAYTSIFGYGDEGYGDHGYGGVPSQEDLQLFPRLTAPFYFDEQVVAQYFDIIIDNGLTEFSIGRMFLSYRFEPTSNFVKGHTFQLVDNSVTTKTYAGNKITDEKERYYKVTGKFKYMLDGEAYGAFLRLINRYGTRKPFVAHFIPDKTSPDYSYTILYGRFTEIPKYTSSNLIGRTQVPFSMEEEI
jgi:hypothetical protein